MAQTDSHGPQRAEHARKSPAQGEDAPKGRRSTRPQGARRVSGRAGSSRAGKAGRREARGQERRDVYYVPTTSKVGGAADARRGSAESRSDRAASSKAPAFLALAPILVLGGGAWYLWTNRTVSVTINEKSYDVRIDSTLAEAVRDQSIHTKPGNYVSVRGDVLKAGGGEPFDATVGKRSLTGKAAQEYRVRANDKITLSAGRDVMEPHTKKVETEAPKLVMKGGYGPIAYVRDWGTPGRVERLTGKKSKQVAEIVKSKTVDTEVYLRTPIPEGDKKLVALTFDDGPSDKYTQQYLDILRKHNAKATFFCLGRQVQEFPQLAKAIVDQGSQIASHTQSHKQLTKLGSDELRTEFDTAFKAINDATGIDTTVFRPPYGAFTERTWLAAGGIPSVSVTWTQDSRDWARPGVDAIVKNSLANVKSGSIILMHDGGGNRDQDVEALPKIIESLQGAGYTLVTIDELMASDSTIPKSIQTGDAKMPRGVTWPTELGDA